MATRNGGQTCKDSMPMARASKVKNGREEGENARRSGTAGGEKQWG